MIPKKCVNLAVFGAFVAIAGCNRPSNDSAVARLDELRDAELPRVEHMSEAERDASRAKLRQQLDGLTKEQRRKFFERSGAQFSQALVRDVDRILALPPDEQRAELDRKIDEFKARNEAASGDTPVVDPKRAEEMQNRVLSVLSDEDRQKLDTYRVKLNERMKERSISPPLDVF